MPNIILDKKKYLELVQQLRGDIGTQINLLNLIIEQMPANAMKTWLEEQYLTRVYGGTYFIFQHPIFTDDIYYCHTRDDLIGFFKDHNIKHEKKFVHNINTEYIFNLAKKGELFCGYKIIIKEGKNGFKYEED